jgi:hypothetical protein
MVVNLPVIEGRNNIMPLNSNEVADELLCSATSKTYLFRKGRKRQCEMARKLS